MPGLHFRQDGHIVRLTRDPAGHFTRVWLDEQEVKAVTGINIDMQMDTVPRVTLTIYPKDVIAEGLPEEESVNAR